MRNSIAAFALAGATVIAAPTISHAETIYVVDQGANTIRKYDSASGAYLGLFASTGLSEPTSLAFDSAGNLFVANYGNNSIVKFTPGGEYSVFASYQSDRNLLAPQGLVFDKAGNLYVANWFGNTIEKFTPQGVGSLFARGLNYPADLAFDGAGNLYVANNGTSTVLKFTPQGLSSVFATSPGWYDPQGLAFDCAGNLYVANVNSHDIQKVTPQGVASVFASGLTAPLSLAFDGAGNLFVVSEGVASPDINKIDEFARDGSYLGVFAKTGLSLPFDIAMQPEPPTINCPVDMTVAANSGCSATNVNLGTPVAGDNCGVASVTNDAPAGYPLGLTLVTWTVTDRSGKSASCVQRVVVLDGTPPEIKGIVATPNVLWPPNHRMVQVNLKVDAVDNCDPSPMSRITNVTSNQPQNPSAPDWEITGPLSVNLRAKRLANSGDRIYTLFVEVADSIGNRTVGTISVTVPDHAPRHEPRLGNHGFGPH